ncbi:helix-turn-helix domain-containing protein [Streptomyces sp. NPDC016469]
MDVRQVAQYLNMSVPWVYREAAAVGLKADKFGNGSNAKIQFKSSEVQAWVRMRQL